MCNALGLSLQNYQSENSYQVYTRRNKRGRQHKTQNCLPPAFSISVANTHLKALMILEDIDPATSDD